MKTTTNQMTSRERVHAAYKGLPVDRTPIFIWLNAHTGCKLMATYKPGRFAARNMGAKFLWKKFETGGNADAPEFWRMAPLMFDIHTFNYANEYGLELGSDILLASFATPWRYSKIYRKNGKFHFDDIYGVTRAMGHGIYPDMVKPAIGSIKDIDTYQFPDMTNESLYNMFRKIRKRYPDTCIAAEVWGSQDFTSTSLFGMEHFMMNLIEYPDEMKSFLRKWTDNQVEVLVRSVRAGADTVFIEEDYGYDNRTFISMDMWKEFTCPNLKRLVDAAHEEGAPVILHSCGYQMPFLPHYVELGIEMLQSFQPKAGNDFEKAMRDYGDKLTFITGIDIQQGEAMSARELKEDILQYYKLGQGRGKGQILGTTHEIQYTMPDENNHIIFDTIKEVQAGRHDNSIETNRGIT